MTVRPGTSSVAALVLARVTQRRAQENNDPELLADATEMESRALAAIKLHLSELPELMDEENKPDAWIEKEGFYAAVGHAISVWAAMETKLVYIFSLLLGIAPERAGLILYSIINFMTWLNLITDLFASEPVFKQFSGGWNKKLERLKALNDTRTRLAHHTSLRQANGPIGLRPSQLDTRSKSLAYHPLTVDEVHDFTAKVVAIHKEIAELFETMALSLLPSDEPPEEPAPDPAE